VNSVLRRTLKREVSFDQHPEFSKVSKQCKQFIWKLLQKDPHDRPTAEQAASQMWCCSGNDMGCGQQTWASSSVGGHSTMDVDAVSSMPEAQFRNQVMPSDHHDQGASSFRGVVHPKIDEGYAKEEDACNRFDSDSARDTDGQRGSFRGWSKKVSRLVSTVRTNKSDGQRSHSSNMDRESSDAERSIISRVDEDGLSTQLHSNSCGRNNSRMQKGSPLLQALKFGKQVGIHDSELAQRGDLKVVPPASRPEHSRPQSLWGRISRGQSRKEAPLRKEVDDAIDIGASSSSLRPVIKNDELGSVFCPTDEGQQPSPAQVPLPPTLPGRYDDTNYSVASSSSLGPGIKHDGLGGIFNPINEDGQPGPPKALPPPTPSGQYDDANDSVPSSSSVGPSIKNDRLGAFFSPIHIGRQANAPKTLPPPTQPRARYRNLFRAKATSVASQAQDVCTEK